MATKIYINTDLKDLTANAVANRNRPTQVVRLPQIVEGETLDVELSLVNSDGTYDSRSGDADVSLAVAVSARGAAATSGTFKLTASTETTAPLAWNASAEAVEGALNVLNGGSGAYGSKVDVKMLNSGSYRIIFKDPGARTDFGGTSIDLAPESEVTIGTAVVGSATTRAQMIIEISQQPAIYTSTWTTGSSKFSGQLDANTARVQELIATGQDAFFEVKTGNDVLCQIPIAVLSAVAAPNSLPAHALPSNLNDFANDPSTNGKFNVTNWLTDLLAPHTKAVWGYITGTLSDQTDLQSALDDKGSASQQTTNTTDIATNAADIATNAADITTNASGIATNAAGITTNASGISTNAAGIVTLQNDKAPKASPVLTGNPTAPTPNAADNSTTIATTAYVDAQNSPNNKGFFANPAALGSAYPTGQSGWYAIVGTTDTFWVWDADDSAWEDTDSNSAGTVTSISVSGGTGISSTGSPVTVTGTIDVALDSATQTTLGKVATNETAIALNTAKVGITSSQATAITDNTAKVGITSSQASAITDNTAKVGITSGQASAITANTAKVGITSSQATAITANTAKVGITTEQASAITANTAKTGITSSQASAIVANTLKTGITSSQATAITDNTAKVGITSGQASEIADNTNKVGITTSQASAITANTNKVGITTSQADAIIANTAKVGITSAQASAITSNTAKVGITSGQASAITANTAKVGITSAQASAITANTSKVGITSGQASAITDNTSDIADLDLYKATKASPVFSGNPTAPTPNAADNSTTIATTAYVDAQTSPNNKGFFATPAALNSAYATGQNGWYAIVGTTDTFWVWDSDTSAWKNTNTNSQGTVTSISVSGGTGLTSTGSPVTTSGTIDLNLDTATQATLAKVSTNETAIALNTAKVGITSAQATAITDNTAKVGITSTQATAITDNSAKVGITSAQASAITANTAKVGITSAQASAITANTAKVGITSSQATAITDNTAKVGITPSQASAITANTAKVGITSTQATAITDNTAKVGITNSQAAAITANTAALALKAPLASPDFTGTVGMGKAGLSGVLDINGDVYIENGKIIGDTGSLDFDSNQSQLILGTVKSEALKVTRVDAASTIVFNVDASSATNGLVTMLNAKVDGDLQVDDDLNADGNVTIDGTTTCANNVIVNNGDITVSDTSGNGTGGKINAKDVTVSNKLYVKEIQAIGSTGATAQPIVYDSIEHRFRDFDADPTNLMVIKKIPGKNGARVGINVSNAADPKCALEVVGQSSDGLVDEAFRVIGGSFFNEYIRIGHYTDATRPTTNARDGMVIYNSTQNDFQGFVSGQGWVDFSTQTSTAAPIKNNLTDTVSLNSMRQMTQAAYDLITPDANTVYIIVG